MTAPLASPAGRAEAAPLIPPDEAFRMGCATGEGDGFEQGREAGRRDRDAEVARLRELLSAADRVVVWESFGFSRNFQDEVNAALATPDAPT